MRQKGFLALPARTLRFFSMTAFVAGLCVFAAALFSCSNLGGDFSGPAMFPDVQLGGTVIPAAIAQGRVTGTIDESGGISKSVVPDASAVQTSVQSYTVKAWGTKADGTAVPEASAIMASVNFSAKTFSINLDYGTWTIRADGYDGPGATGNIVLTQTTATPIELSSDNPVVSLNFALDYPKIAGQKGALALDFVCSTSGIIQIAYTLTDSAVPPNVIVDGIEQNHSGFTGSWTLSAASTGEAALATLEPGDYQLVVEFRAGDGSTILRLDQIVQIYSNITTTKIDGVAPYINAGGAIDITDDVVKKYQQSVVYVGGTGFKTNTPASDSNNGTQFDPVEHFERAIQIINASPLTSSDLPDGFKVYVQDNLSLAQDVSIAGSKKITVIGTNTSAPFKIDGATMAYGIETSASDLNFSYINFDGIKSFDVTGGQIKLNNCKITNGVKPITGSATGGGINVTAAGAKAVLTNCSISGCQACYGGAIYVSADTGGSGTAEVELNNCLIGAESSSPAQSGDGYHSNKANGGGGIYVGGSGRLAFVGTNKISYNYATGSGGGININGNGDNEFAGVQILNNASVVSGGGVYVAKKLALDSATISGNVSSGNGGGVYANSSFSTFKFQGGTISANSAGEYGGGVYVGGGATMLMSGDAVIGDKDAPSYATEHAYSNSADNGGGIAVDNASVYIGYTASSSPQDSFTGGIYYNSAVAVGGGGGGVYMSDDSANKLYFYKGNVDKNCGLYYGGAVCCGNAGELKITKTVIGSNVTAYYGGGICIGGGTSSTAQVTIEDALIQENIALKDTDGAEGGAICAASFDSFVLKGSVYIPAGVGGATGAGKNDVFLGKDGLTITVGSTLTAVTTPVATITPELYAPGTEVLSDASSGTLVQSEMSKFAVAEDSTGESWTIGYDSATQKGVLATANIYVNGTASGSEAGTKTDPCKTVAKALTKVAAPNTNIILLDDTVETEDLEATAAMEGLTIKSDTTEQRTITGAASWVIRANKKINVENICLDGWDYFTLVQEATLNDVLIRNFQMHAGAAGALQVYGMVEATNLTFDNCHGGSYGGAVCVSGASAKFVADGLTITACGSNSGGAIYNNGTAILKNAKISGCTATTGKGIHNNASANLVLDGVCDISDDIYYAGGSGAKPLFVASDFALASGASKIPLRPKINAAPSEFHEDSVLVQGYDDGTTAHSLTAVQAAAFNLRGTELSLRYDASGAVPVAKLRDLSIAGGITVSLAGNISFAIAVPSLTSARAAFEVKDNSSSPATTVTPDSARIEVRQYGSAVYAADDQEVAAPYLAAGSYELYCKAVVGGNVYDTTVPFGYGALYTPLTLEAESAATTVTFTNKAAGPVTYRVNGGTEQTIASGGSEAITLATAGSYVQFFGDNAAYATDSSSTDSSNIACSDGCYVYGNIMSLVKSAGFESETALTGNYAFCMLFSDNANIKNKAGAELVLPATTLTNYCYCMMFGHCENITTAPALPATVLADNCYRAMFTACKNLAEAPELPATVMKQECYCTMFDSCENLEKTPDLPATSLAWGCYTAMFRGCKKLTTVPASLPVEALQTKCYSEMFSGCASLTTAPALPSKALNSSCYYRMFAGCTSLAVAPALPATTLAAGCYSSMFSGCTSLTSAPELPATTLASNCYFEMFKGCSSLNSVTCLATDISATDCTKDWLSGVASIGTFTKAAAMNGWTLDNPSGIPTGWTVKSAGSAIPAGFVKVEGSTIVGGSKFTNNGYTGVFVDGRTVTLSDFYMCDHEVTQAEYQAVMGSNPSYFTGSDGLPVEKVSWYDALVYCNKKSIAESLDPCYTINGKTNPSDWGTVPTSSDATWNDATCNLNANGYRLPTEAEWEYAALGGKAGVAADDPTDYAGTNDSGSLGTYAWYSGNSDNKTHAVKTKTKNGLGLFDMSGNVLEWCWDLYNSSATAGDNGSASVTNPLGASSGSYRVFRGGSWYVDAGGCSVAGRNSNYPYSRNRFLGFRVVRNAP